MIHLLLSIGSLLGITYLLNREQLSYDEREQIVNEKLMPKVREILNRAISNFDSITDDDIEYLEITANTLDKWGKPDDAAKVRAALEVIKNRKKYNTVMEL